MTVRFSNKFRMRLRRYGIKSYQRFLTVLEDSPVFIAADYLEEIAQDMADDVVKYIEKQPHYWPVLKERYREWKLRNELDERMLIATGDYIDSIGIQQIKRGKGVQIRVGVPNKTIEDTDLKYDQLARIHEYGTETIPARPHWRPVFNKWRRRKGVMSRKLLKDIEEEIIKEVKKMVKRETEATDVRPNEPLER